MGFMGAPIYFYLTVALRLILACVLGGIIGYEREHMNKPAGLRTHTLVCVGSALVMITSEFIFNRYSGVANADPARLGAQVISGIGFLGAGTIIHEGFSIKGLTTAATLWVVACVGIAVGIGFYEGAIITTILIYITLIVLKRFQDNFTKRSHYKVFIVQSKDVPGQIGNIGSVFGKYNISIKNIEFVNVENEGTTLVRFTVKCPHNLDELGMISDLNGINGVQKVYEE